jgi:hypothetical protein
MKRLLLLLAITSVSVLTANAQCVPDLTFTEPGVYPDEATGLENACVGEFYEQIVTTVVPVDTTVEISPLLPPVTLDFDSIVIVSFTGLPASMTYDCSSILGGCTFTGGETGCLIVTGTPTAGEEGIYTPVITVDVYLGGSPLSQATEIIDWYVIEVFAAGSCTNSLAANTNEALSLYPNPTESALTLEGLNASTNIISIVNMNGQVMDQYSMIDTNSLEMNVTNLETGIYFVKIDSANASKTIRFIKK